MAIISMNELSEDARVLNVVVGSEERDISLARDSTHVVLVYAESMQRLAPDEPIAALWDRIYLPPRVRTAWQPLIDSALAGVNRRPQTSHSLVALV